jgi:sugar fermentation stimulation protein A
LTTAVSRGEKAAVVFVIQRADAQCFAPHDRADAAFGAALRKAASVGVGVYGWTCEVSREAIAMAEQVPVDLT